MERGGGKFRYAKEDKARFDDEKKKKKGNSFFPGILIPWCIAFLKKARKWNGEIPRTRN